MVPARPSQGCSAPAKTIRLIDRPDDAPQLNPQDPIWDEARDTEYPNRVFADRPRGTRQIQSCLSRLASDSARLRSRPAWSGLVNLNLNRN
jgi:hypothetical protein